MEDIKKTFINPGREYRAKPFWSWNGELKEKELIRQAEIFKKMGFGGYFMHSRCGLATEYLGKEWFELTNAVSDFSKEIGMEAWLYDEDRWPSGSAGGKVTEDERFRRKALYIFEMPAEKFAWSDDIFCAFAAEIHEDGLSMRDYRRIETGETVPVGEDGAWKKRVLVYKLIQDAPNSNCNGNTYIDVMNRAAVDRFIELTHEQYLKNCGSRIGTDILGIFTDEPERGSCLGSLKTEDGVRSNSIFYTDDIFDEFKTRYGYDALAVLPEIFYRKNGEKISKVRMDYIDLGCNLFNERYAMPIHDWCKKHNMRYTGHVLHEDMLSTQTAPNGSLMRYYQHMDDPGIDILGNDNRCYWAAKQCSSVCRQFGKKWMLSEMYGCTGWEFTLRSHKIIGDWQALFGVNVRCPHLSWYTMEGEGKRDYPASISYQSPYWRNYAFVESYFARMGLLLASGRPVCDLLVLEPVETVWGLVHIDWANWIFPKDETVCGIEKIYADTFKALAGARIDFDYGEEQIMAQHARIEKDERGALLTIGQMSYRTLLISGAMTVRKSTLDLAKAFLLAGGNVVFAGDLPGYVGGEPSDACAELIALGARQVAPEDLTKVVGELSACPVTADAPGTVFNQVRKDGGDYISVWLNTDDQNGAEFTVSASLPEDYRAEFWNLETGERFAYPSERKNGALRMTCRLAPAGTMALVFSRACDVLHDYDAAPSILLGSLTEGEFDYKLDEPNVCVLDYARAKFGEDVDFSPLVEILKADQALRDRLGIERRGGEMLQPWFAKEKYRQSFGTVTVEYPFEIGVMPEGDVCLAAERPDCQAYFVNGVRVEPQDMDDFWVDNAFVKMRIPAGVLHIGKNIVTMTCDFRRTTNLEAVYLLGRFGVKAAAGSSELTSLPDTLTLDDETAQNLPFYTGRTTLTITPERYAPLVKQAKERVILRVADYGAALVTVSFGGVERELAWEPYEADVTEAVKQRLPIEITLVNSRRNTFGPLHIVPTRLSGYGPVHFTTEGREWTDDYAKVDASFGKVEFLTK